MQWDNFRKYLKDFKLLPEPSPFQNRDSRLQKDHNWSVLGWVFGKLGDALEDVDNSIKQRFKDYDGRFNDQLNKTTNIDEVIDARRPKNQEAFDKLGDREDSQDQSIDSISQAQASLAANTMQVNTEDLINKMSILAVQPRPEGSANFAQTMQLDSQTGLLYIAEQTDDAGSQYINEYDPKTHELVRSRYLGINAVTWLEGNSLFHNQNGDVCFIVPKDAKGNWGIYNYESDSWDKSFKLSTGYKYCIDNLNKYFVTMQSSYSQQSREDIIGFNLYDLQSVIDGFPVQVKFIPVLDNYVHGNNKIQGFAMIDNNIYIGRGKRSTADWFRTTEITDNGSVIGDWRWDEQQLIELIQPQVAAGHQLTDIESEGMSINYINGEYIPVMIVLASGQDVNGKRTIDYALINTFDPDGTEIGYTAGLGATQLTRVNDSGIHAGLAIQAGSSTPDILDAITNIKQPGTYGFNVSEKNPGLGKYMASGGGTAVVREVKNGNANAIYVDLTDYNGIHWTNYYDQTAETGEFSTHPHWVGWSSASNSMIVADANFDPFASPSGIYSTQSTKNSPTTAVNKVYQIYSPGRANSTGKIIVCYDIKYNVMYLATYFLGVKSGWKQIADKS